MKKTILTTLVFLVMVVAANSQNNFVGRWIGTWGSGAQENPNHYSFQFNGDGTLQLYDQNSQVIASGSYQPTGSQFTATYNYTSGGTYAVSGSIDAASTLRGTWGSGNNVSGGGRWVMNKNQTAVAGTNAKFVGRWIGTWGNGSNTGPNYYSFMFQAGNQMQLLNQAGQVIANGTYSFANNQLNATYLYNNNGGTFSVSAIKDASGTLKGTWGSGAVATGGGSWIMNSAGTTNAVVVTKQMKRICVDRIINTGSLPARNFSAVTTPPRINPDGTIITQTGVIRQPLAGETDKMWDPGATINVFLDNNTSSFVQRKVQQYALEWSKYANIKFAFVYNRSEAQIKVGFDTADGKSWSMIGKDVLFNPLGLNTMNFGWFTDNTSENEFSRTVIHEFGHALGFIHEHQSPVAGIQWDKEKVYATFAEKPNEWTRGEVDVNVFNRYSRTSTNFSAYDRLSIMHYFFPDGLTTDGSSFSMNTNFSPIDKQYAGIIYPFPPTPSNANGVLRTGDDCDEISFSVEYNAVDPGNVEFVLSLGNANGKTLTWWKQIGIPKTNNTETPLWVQNHSLISSENRTTFSQQIPFIEIDRNKGISFWKAKFAGVHTLLGYKWNILPCITGGCRVRLTWNKDSCL
jgi:serralysin